MSAADQVLGKDNGEALLVAVVPVPDRTLAEDELVVHCRGKVGGYQMPHRYLFLDELRRSAMDKILTTELRRTYGKKE